MFSNTAIEGNSINRVDSREIQNKTLSFWILTILIASTLEYLFTSILAYTGVAPFNYDFRYIYPATKLAVPFMLLFIWVIRGHIVTKLGSKVIMSLAKIAAFASVAVFMWQVFSFIAFLVL